MKLEIYYSVQNGGDGSAYPMFFDNKELSEWDQDHMGDEGWGEPCCGSIVVESESPVVCGQVVTLCEYYVEHMNYGPEDWEDYYVFVDNFFSDERPQFQVRMSDDNRFYEAFVGDIHCGQKYARGSDKTVGTKEWQRLEWEKQLNGTTTD